MTERQLIDKWLGVFGENVSRENMEERVTDEGCYLWHIFSFEFVECLKGNEARRAFDELEYERAIRFYDGYSSGHSNSISDVAEVGRLTSKDLDDDRHSDVYVTAEDFSWTYVRTHEDMCGPYFCIKK